MRGRRRSPVGVGADHSGHRGFRSGGGFRRNGQPKLSSYSARPPPPPPPPPPRPLRHRGDVLLEAGRLAAEYLVSKGLLSVSSLPPSPAGRWWPKGDDEEGGRASALSRLGRRRFDDEEEEGSFGGRKRARRRRNRSGPYSRRGLEWGRENGRGGPWEERGRGCSDAMDDEDMDRSGRWSGRGKGTMDPMEDEDSYLQDRSEDSGFCDGGGGGREPLKAATTDDQFLPSKGEMTGGSKLELENHICADETGSKTVEEIEMKTNPAPEADMTMETRSDDNKVSDLEVEKVEKVKGIVKADQQGGLHMGEEEDLTVKSSPAMEDKQMSNHGINLLLRFAEVPTKPRSSVTNRNPRTDQKPSAEDTRENSDVVFKEGVLENIADEVSMVSHLNDALTDQLQSSRGLPSIISAASSFSDSLINQPHSSRGIVPGVSWSQSTQLVESVECHLMTGAESRSCSRSHSFPESSSLAQVPQEISEGPPGFELPRESIDADGAKIDESRPAKHMKREEMKQPREWSPSSLSNMDEYFHSSGSKQFNMPVEKLSQDHEMVDATEQNHADEFPKAAVKSVHKFGEERQLASASFKICDLNLMETPEITDISNGPVLEHVPTSAVSLETENNQSVSFDLSICQRQNDSHGHHTNDNKVIQVIDLEDDSHVEVNACDTSQTRREPMYPNLENFLNHPVNPIGMSNIQDGYGLAISEFLGNDIEGCPAVQGDISDLQTFHGAEGIAGNDDSLYATLGEIPLNFMDVWDQPPPEYEKFF